MAHTHRVSVEMQNRQLFTLGCYTVTYPWGRCKIARLQDCKITSPPNCPTSIYLASYYSASTPNLAPEVSCHFLVRVCPLISGRLPRDVPFSLMLGADVAWMCHVILGCVYDCVIWVGLFGDLVVVVIFGGDTSYLYTTTNMSRYGECKST